MEPTPLIVEEITDPVEIARIHAQHAQAQRNGAWLENH